MHKLKKHNSINNQTFKLIGIAILMIVVGCNNHKNFTDTIELKNGDIIFRKGSSKESIAVQIADKGERLYTHVGIIVEYGGELMALHAVPDEAKRGEIDIVKLESLGEFFSSKKAINGGIYRVPLSEDALKIVTEQCMYYYNVKMPFDNDYNIKDTTELYCTELLFTSFKKVGYDITAGNSTYLNTILFSGRYIFPSDIIKNMDIKLIYSY